MPKARPPDLPDYKSPPLVEVALSVQFDELKRLDTAHFGLLWKKFRKHFPRTEHHEELDSLTENFERSLPARPSIQLQTLDRPPAPRIWFLNAAGTELIQVQRTRFVHNWRKVGSDDVYPRYERIRATFGKNLRTFREFLRTEGLGSLSANQCEVTYVNHIMAGEGWESHADVAKLFAVLGMGTSDDRTVQPEDVGFAARFLKQSDDGSPMGRLHVNLRPALSTEDGRPMYVLTLTARGNPLGQGNRGVLAFLDVGREWIVKDFTSITTSFMHKVWGRFDG